MATQKQKYLRCVAGFWLAVIGLIVIARHLWMDWVPDPVIAGLPTADKAEIRQMLGNPTEEHSGMDNEKWVYRRQTRLAEFRVFFKPDGTVDRWSYDR